MAKSIIYLLPLIVCSVGSLAPTVGHAGTLYKWRDEQGRLHYGDAVPPSYAQNNREMINDQGVTLKSLPGRKTLAQRRAEARREAARKVVEAHRHSDRVLLDTYTSVEDIEQARDNRLDTLQSQIRITSNNIGYLERQVAALETRISTLKKSDKTVHDMLDKQLKSMRLTLLRNRRFLQARQQAQALVRKAFSKKVARFRALKTKESTE